MATPNEKLAASLARLEALQGDGRRVFRSGELSRVHRERLVRHGFLREVMKKNWLISCSPDTEPGDTTPWFASFWEFCAAYCTDRFGADWHLSPEQSLLLHAQNTIIPPQVVVYTPKGANNTIELPFGTSLYDLKQKAMPPKADLTEQDGLRLFVPEAALVRASAVIFTRFPAETLAVLANIRDETGVLRRLLSDGKSVVAGRLAGAFRRAGRAAIADEILHAMKTADYKVYETDPFAAKQAPITLKQAQPPIVSRLQSMWAMMREVVIQAFPQAPGLPKDKAAYLSFVDDLYQNDAYHSLSIEGYRVTLKLVERVRAGDWAPDKNADDRQLRDTLAARGYWQAFGQVRAAVGEIIKGGNAVSLVRKAHRDWYRELFQPFAAAGLIEPADLAGYRNDAVFIRGSRHIPPRWELMPDAMPALFNLMKSETEPSVRAVLGHWLFGYIHPYPDGNGRLVRFVMNAMLASGGYPWTVIRVQDRDAYMKALETASIDGNITPFAKFVASRVRRSMSSMKKAGQGT